MVVVVVFVVFVRCWRNMKVPVIVVFAVLAQRESPSGRGVVVVVVVVVCVCVGVGRREGRSGLGVCCGGATRRCDCSLCVRGLVCGVFVWYRGVSYCLSGSVVVWMVCFVCTVGSLLCCIVG